ncbi:GTP-binding protein Era [Robiginitalea myxolifaciens]|uniref:GTPase Era n=1 Tax=Robiginitalea myxolifaciens TaxID=400055 RepID=A0A1I6GCZ4_9FLAO|nr:GTPase Era [Robiginitalea myxolifaciens]SFR39947.1 GTP-binding protein Era [Robiginitalea myxolifaciens]
MMEDKDNKSKAGMGQSNSTPHKSGFVNIIGNPNVGKSTLMNALVGERLSIITSKAQTTRHRILGIVNGEDFQVVLSDTPGIIKPAYELQESMMDFVRSAMDDADVLIYMVEIGEQALKDAAFFEKIKNSDIPVLLLLNKIDKSSQEELEAQVAYWTAQLPKAEIVPISALEGFGIENVFKRLLELLPEAPPFFPKDQLTDRPERFFVSEIIREKILQNYKKEIPYAVEIETESFKEEEALIRINAVIMVERETQKGIIIGHKGSALKRVGVEARKDLETFFAKQVHLELFVKVNKNWRSNPRQLRRFGYSQQ